MVGLATRNLKKESAENAVYEAIRWVISLTSFCMGEQRKIIWHWSGVSMTQGFQIKGASVSKQILAYFYTYYFYFKITKNAGKSAGLFAKLQQSDVQEVLLINFISQGWYKSDWYKPERWKSKRSREGYQASIGRQTDQARTIIHNNKITRSLSW